MPRFTRFAILFAFFISGCAVSQATKNKALYHYQMGESFYAESNFTSALVEYSEAEKLTPKDPALLNDLGLAYFRKGRYDLAEQKYLKAIDLKPDFSDARNNLGVNYLEMKRWDDAIAQFKTVQDDIFYQGQENVAINLGLAYLGKGDNQQALNVLHRQDFRDRPPTLRPLQHGRRIVAAMAFGVEEPEQLAQRREAACD